MVILQFHLPYQNNELGIFKGMEQELLLCSSDDSPVGLGYNQSLLI